MPDSTAVEVIPEIKRTRLGVASFVDFPTYTILGDTWSPNEVDKLESYDINKFKKVVSSCRFFYRNDPIASTVINKMVEIGITSLVLIRVNSLIMSLESLQELEII